MVTSSKQVVCGVPLSSGRLLGRHCGSNLPPSFDTSDSFAYVRFVTDSSGNAPGFSLSFEASVEGTDAVTTLLIIVHRCRMETLCVENLSFFISIY